MRVTKHILEQKVAYLNRVAGTPETQYTKDDAGKLHGNEGNYHISYAYGGTCLYQMSKGTGASDVLRRGHQRTGVTADLIDAYTTGIIDAKEAMRNNH